MSPTTTRRRLLESAFVGGLAGLAGCSGVWDPASGPTASTPTGSTPTAGTDGQAGDGTGRPAPLPGSVALEPLATGLEAPVDVAFAPDADRRYVVDQYGRIYVHDSEGLREEPFLDLGDEVEAGGERGLLGLALHPRFPGNRRLFVRYSAPSREGTPSSYSHTFVLAEFTANADGTRVPVESERTVLEIPQPQPNHNAGSIAFGPDGYLHVGVGDGGGAGDQGEGHVEDWYDDNEGGNGQDVTENLLGSVLRIDVDGRSGGNEYAVPEDNPLVGREGLDEQYAWGLRNPWRFSFDGGDCFVADVGQNEYEEVNLLERGGNFGWNVKEGTSCYEADECPGETPADVRGGEPLLDPIVEYPHSGAEVSGVSVIGGHVYRGDAIPGLEGRYVFGDLEAEGRLFVATPPAGDGSWSTDVVPLGGDGEAALERLLSFGRDAEGEVYALGTGEDGGGVYQLTPSE